MPKKQQKKGLIKEQRALVEKGDGTEYGLVVKKHGNGRFLVKLNMQNKEVIARLAGKFRQKSAKRANWVDVNSVVLISMRDFQDSIVDIVHVYQPDEVRQLRKSGSFVEESVRRGKEEDDNGFEFEGDDNGFDFSEI